MSKNIGICFGGYCPMHQGHLDVIMRAKKESDIVYVVVCGYTDEPRANELGLNIKQRERLIREYFKGDEIIRVITANDTELGIDESMSDHNWKVWTDYVKKRIVHKVMDHNDSWPFTPDDDIEAFELNLTFYVGEKFYVESLNKLNYKAVLVGYDDSLPSNRHNDISATLIRQRPQLYWDKIVSTFKPKLTKKILVLGTASEGKSTLVKDIGNYFQIPYTTEFGRDYMEKHCMLDPDITVNDFIEFLIGQRQYYFDALNSDKNKGVIISDTDNLVTLMYAKAYTQDENMQITEKEYNDILLPLAKSLQTNVDWDVIYLIKPHSTFVDDGTRYMEQSSLEERMKNYHILIKLLEDFGLLHKVVELDGTFLEHFDYVKNYINTLYEKY